MTTFNEIMWNIVMVFQQQRDAQKDAFDKIRKIYGIGHEGLNLVQGASETVRQTLLQGLQEKLDSDRKYVSLVKEYQKEQCNGGE